MTTTNASRAAARANAPDPRPPPLSLAEKERARALFGELKRLFEAGDVAPTPAGEEPVRRGGGYVDPRSGQHLVSLVLSSTPPGPSASGATQSVVFNPATGAAWHVSSRGLAAVEPTFAGPVFVGGLGRRAYSPEQVEALQALAQPRRPQPPVDPGPMVVRDGMDPTSRR